MWGCCHQGRTCMVCNMKIHHKCHELVSKPCSVEPKPGKYVHAEIWLSDCHVNHSDCHVTWWALLQCPGKYHIELSYSDNLKRPFEYLSPKEYQIALYFPQSWQDMYMTQKSPLLKTGCSPPFLVMLSLECIHCIAFLMWSYSWLLQPRVRRNPERGLTCWVIRYYYLMLSILGSKHSTSHGWL